MPCACTQCERHAAALGLAQSPSSRAVLRKAFRATARLWHPDQFEKEPERQREAEEQFKQIQIAYRELSEHYENPRQWPVEEVFGREVKADSTPAISFGAAAGCFVAPDFSPRAERIIAAHVREPDRALAMVDLSGPGVPPGQLAQYILFTDHGLFVRDALGILSLLWYTDLGKVRLVDKRRNGRLGLWPRFIERLSGTEQKYVLEIGRRDGTLFHAISSQLDDSLKKVIYNFLQQQNPQPHP